MSREVPREPESGPGGQARGGSQETTRIKKNLDVQILLKSLGSLLYETGSEDQNEVRWSSRGVGDAPQEVLRGPESGPGAQDRALAASRGPRRPQEAILEEGSQETARIRKNLAV